jgi:hypothetical protein
VARYCSVAANSLAAGLPASILSPWEDGRAFDDESLQLYIEDSSISLGDHAPAAFLVTSPGRSSIFFHNSRFDGEPEVLMAVVDPARAGGDREFIVGGPSLEPGSKIMRISESKVGGLVVTRQCETPVFIAVTDFSKWTGAVIDDNDNPNTVISVDPSSRWTLTEDSYVAALLVDDLDVIASNGFTIYYDPCVNLNDHLQEKKVDLDNGGFLRPLKKTCSESGRPARKPFEEGDLEEPEGDGKADQLADEDGEEYEVPAEEPADDTTDYHQPANENDEEYKVPAQEHADDATDYHRLADEENKKYKELTEGRADHGNGDRPAGEDGKGYEESAEDVDDDYSPGSNDGQSEVDNQRGLADALPAHSQSNDKAEGEEEVSDKEKDGGAGGIKRLA